MFVAWAALTVPLATLAPVAWAGTGPGPAAWAGRPALAVCGLIVWGPIRFLRAAGDVPRPETKPPDA